MGIGIMKSPPKFAPGAAARVVVVLAAGEVDSPLPVLPDGQRPRYVMISSNLAAVICFGDAGVSASTNGMVNIPANGMPMIFDVSGYTHISTLAAGAGALWCTALTNQ